MAAKPARLVVLAWLDLELGSHGRRIGAGRTSWRLSAQAGLYPDEAAVAPTDDLKTLDCLFRPPSRLPFGDGRTHKMITDQPVRIQISTRTRTTMPSASACFSNNTSKLSRLGVL